MTTAGLSELRFYVPPDTRRAISADISWLTTDKLNLT